MRAFLKLIRFENILFVVATQLLMSYAVVQPILSIYKVDRYLPVWVQWAMILGTAFITMGGYVINDYFDVKIDEINHPQKVIIGRAIKRKKSSRFASIIDRSWCFLWSLGCLAGVVSDSSYDFHFYSRPAMVFTLPAISVSSLSATLLWPLLQHLFL